MIYLLDTSAVLVHYRQVDSLIAASAQQRGACLVHRDGHFAAIPPDLLPTIDLAPQRNAGDPGVLG